jgi:hypothetical protein
MVTGSLGGTGTVYMNNGGRIYLHSARRLQAKGFRFQSASWIACMAGHIRAG